jgi:hypothetical protein
MVKKGSAQVNVKRTVYVWVDFPTSLILLFNIKFFTILNYIHDNSIKLEGT